MGTNKVISIRATVGGSTAPAASAERPERLEIARLGAAVSALGDVDVAAWSEDALREQIGELSAALCALDRLVSQVADGVRARGLRIEEPIAA
jgi:hypothetical protein